MEDATDYILKLNMKVDALDDLEIMRIKGGYETYGDLISDALRLVNSLHKWGDEGFDTLVFENSQTKGFRQIELNMPDGILIANKR